MKNQYTDFEYAIVNFTKALYENAREIELNEHVGTDIALSLTILFTKVNMVANEKKGNHNTLCKGVEQFISALRRYSEYDHYIPFYLHFVKILKDEQQAAAPNKKKLEKPGVVCMNLKSGMVYISK